MLSNDSVQMWIDKNIPEYRLLPGGMLFDVIKGLLSEIIGLQAEVDTIKRDLGRS